MPQDKGNIFRGRFGYLLHYIACIGDTKKSCEKKCQYPDRCIYSKCFETPVPKDSPILRGQPFAPHPFILQPPRTGKLDYVPGDTFTCSLILIGEAINLLPWIVFTFYRMGKSRLGLQGIWIWTISYHFTILKRFSNQSNSSDCVTIPRQIRITKIMETQISSLIARLVIPMTRIMANIAAIIKKGGELMNSGISIYNVLQHNQKVHHCNVN